MVLAAPYSEEQLEPRPKGFTPEHSIAIKHNPSNHKVPSILKVQKSMDQDEEAKAADKAKELHKPNHADLADKLGNSSPE